MKFSSLFPLGRRLPALLATLVFAISIQGQSLRETAHALTDKQCYIAGEPIHVSIVVTDADGQPSAVSRVAFVEVTDTRHLCAQGMASLSKGRGWADIDLPATLHSGNYLLSVYTRAMTGNDPTGIHQQIITIINPLHVSRYDDITFVDTTGTKMSGALLLKEELVKDMPHPSTILLATLSVTSVDLQVPDYSAFHPALQAYPSSNSNQPLPEVEGHLVGAAAPQDASDVQARMAMVGGHAVLFDGQPQPNGSILFYTDELYGSQPTLLAGNDSTGASVALRFTSPYVTLLPERLPHAQVSCSRDDLLKRSIDAQLRSTLARQVNHAAQAQHDEHFYATTPMQYYDLDEWTRLNSVREILIEFIRGVKRIRQGDCTELHVYDTEESHLSEWPALVLLDGVPVYDIDEFLDYDARLLKYVQVYSGRYTFGASVCQGVISFVSQHGLLPNRRLDATVQLVTRVFPQQRPSFVRPAEAVTGTLWWNPDVDPLHLPSADDLRALCPSGATATLQFLLTDGTRVTRVLKPV